MNLGLINQSVKYIIEHIKGTPSQWSLDQIKKFCDLVKLDWVVPVLKPNDKRISSRSNENENSSTTEEAKDFQNIPNNANLKDLTNRWKFTIMDACLQSFDQINQILLDHQINRMISNANGGEDINMYYQVLKLKFWSFFLLQYNLNRNLLKLFISKIECKVCTAQLRCSCDILNIIQFQLDMFIKQLLADPEYEKQYKCFPNLFLNDNTEYFDACVVQRRTIRSRSLYISENLINVVQQQSYFLSKTSPLFWDVEEVVELVQLIKLQDYSSILAQNQIDGFVLLIFVNPPFVEADLFLKCLLLKRMKQNEKGNIQQSQQLRYYKFNSLLYLLNHLLSQMNFTIYCQEPRANKQQPRKCNQSFQANSQFYFEWVELQNPQPKITVQPKVIRTQTLFNEELLLLANNLQTFQTDQTQSKVVSRQLFSPGMLTSKSISPSKSTRALEKQTQQIQMGKIAKKNNLGQLNIYKKKLFNLQDDMHTSSSFNSISDLSPKNEKVGDAQQANLAWIIMEDRNESVQFMDNELFEQLPQIQIFNQNPIGNQRRGESINLEGAQNNYEQYLSKIQQQETENDKQEQYGTSVNLEGESIIMENVVQQQSILLEDVKNNFQQQESIAFDNESQIFLPQSLPPQGIQLSNQQKVKTLLDVIQITTLQSKFDPLDFSQITELRLKIDVLLKVQNVLISGARFGRSKTNDFPFSDQTKISSQHARVTYRVDKFMLQDLGSKGGTFLKIINDVILEEGMNIYIGNKFGFRITSIEKNEHFGIMAVDYEREENFVKFIAKMKLGDKWRVGRDKTKNQSTLAKSQCHKLLSPSQFEIVYCMNWKLGYPCFMINDKGSKNGTWLRLSDKQLVSKYYPLDKSSIFNLSFEVQLEVVEICQANS